MLDISIIRSGRDRNFKFLLSLFSAIRGSFGRFPILPKSYFLYFPSICVGNLEKFPVISACLLVITIQYTGLAIATSHIKSVNIQSKLPKCQLRSRKKKCQATFDRLHFNLYFVSFRQITFILLASHDRGLPVSSIKYKQMERDLCCVHLLLRSKFSFALLYAAKLKKAQFKRMLSKRWNDYVYCILNGAFHIQSAANSRHRLRDYICEHSIVEEKPSKNIFFSLSKSERKQNHFRKH